MNREFKRRMKKDEKSSKKMMSKRRQAAAAQASAPRRERVGMRQFIREIRAELKRVIWPSRSEVVTYSVVVVFVVVLLAAIVFVMDLGFAKGVLQLFQTGTETVANTPVPSP